MEKSTKKYYGNRISKIEKGKPCEPLFILGQTGIGKSAFLNRLLVEIFNGFGKIVMCPNLSLADFLGIGYETTGISRANPLFFENELFTATKPYLLVLEELPRVYDPDIIPKLFGLLYDRNLAGKRISDFVVVIATGNIGKNSKGANLLDDASYGRMLVLPFVPEMEENVKQTEFDLFSSVCETALDACLSNVKEVYGYKEAETSMNIVYSKTQFMELPFRRLSFMQSVLPFIYLMVRKGEISKDEIPYWEFSCTLTPENRLSLQSKNLIESLRKVFLNEDIISFDELKSMSPEDILKQKSSLQRRTISIVYAYCIVNKIIPNEKFWDWALSEKSKEVTELEMELKKFNSKLVTEAMSRSRGKVYGDKAYTKPIKRILSMNEEYKE